MGTAASQERIIALARLCFRIIIFQTIRAVKVTVSLNIYNKSKTLFIKIQKRVACALRFNFENQQYVRTTSENNRTRESLQLRQLQVDPKWVKLIFEYWVAFSYVRMFSWEAPRSENGKSVRLANIGTRPFA